MVLNSKILNKPIDLENPLILVLCVTCYGLIQLKWMDVIQVREVFL